MLYEYPDEFIVAVTYTDIFNNNSNESEGNYINEYKSEFKEEGFYRRYNPKRFRKNNKNEKHKMNESMERDNSKDDNVFEEFINIGLIQSEDVKKFLVVMNLFGELDNDYAKSQIKTK